MRTLDQLINRQKSLTKNSTITSNERTLLETAIQEHIKKEPAIIYTREGVRARTKWYNRLHELQRALDLH